MFMNNGGFNIFPRPAKQQRPTTKRASIINKTEEEEAIIWNARDEMRLLDAVEQVKLAINIYFLQTDR